MQFSRSAKIREFATQFCHSVADHSPVSFYLCFSGAAKKAEAAALSLKMGPAADQSTGLIIEMRYFDLKAPFGACCAFPKDFKDQPGSVDHLGIERLFQIVLLDRCQRAINDDNINVIRLCTGPDVIHLPRSEQRCRFCCTDAKHSCVANIKANGRCKPDSFFKTRTRASQATFAKIRENDDRPGAAGNAIIFLSLKDAQVASASPSSARFIGCVGWIVEIACL